MKKFEIGKTYTMRSACNHECVWAYEVLSRTAQTITVKCLTTNNIKKCRVNKYLTERNNQEAVFPLGNYSMAPILRA